MVENPTHNYKIKGLNPNKMAKCDVGIGVGSGQVVTVVEHPTHNCKIKGLNPTTDTRRDKMVKHEVGIGVVSG